MKKILKILTADSKLTFLAVLISGLLIFLDLTYVLPPQSKTLKELNPKVKTLEMELDNAESSLARMQAIKKQEQLKPQNESAVKKVIAEEEMPRLFEQLSLLANKNGVKILLLKPVKDSPNLLKFEKTMIAEKFKPLLIAMDLHCGYHNFVAFLNGLFELDKFICVHDFTISVLAKEYQRQKVSLTLKGYVRK